MSAYISVARQGGTLADNNLTILHMLGLMVLFAGLCFWRFKVLAGRSFEDTQKILQPK